MVYIFLDSIIWYENANLRFFFEIQKQIINYLLPHHDR